MNTLTKKVENFFVNYFLGKNILDEYEDKKALWMDFLGSGKDLEKKFKKLDRQKVKHIVFGKVFPDLIFSASIVYAIITKKPAYLMGIGVSEYLRSENNLRFQTELLEESITYHCELSKQHVKNIEQSVKSITSKLA